MKLCIFDDDITAYVENLMEFLFLKRPPGTDNNNIKHQTYFYVLKINIWKQKFRTQTIYNCFKDNETGQTLASYAQDLNTENCHMLMKK